jgi:hypothetical protein
MTVEKIGKHRKELPLKMYKKCHNLKPVLNFSQQIEKP